MSRCQAKTKSGTRCKRDAQDDSKYCYQHQEKEINDELTDKQRLFIEEYLLDLNATQAAIRAGYSEDTARQQGSRLLSNVNIQKEIKKAKQERIERTKITQDRVLKELSKIGFADINDFLRFGTEKTVIGRDESGEPITDYANVVELKDSQEVDGSVISEVQLKDGKLKFKLHDKMKALNDIGRHLGMFNDKLDITTNGESVNQMTPEEREKRRQELRKRLGDD